MESNEESILDIKVLLRTVARLWVWFFFTLALRVIFHLVIAAIVGGIVYFILRHDEDWRGTMGAVIAFLINGGCGFFIAFQTSLLLVSVKAFQQVGIGQIVFDFMFSRVQGIEPESSEHALTVTDAADGMTEPELRSALHSAANGFLSDVRFDDNVPLALRWVTKKIISIGTWGVVKVVMIWAGKRAADGTKVFSIYTIRKEIGSRIDDELANVIKEGINDNVKSITLILVVLTLIVAAVVRWYLG